RDGPGEERRLGEIAERWLARPGPVLRLVKEQIDTRERKADKADQRQDGQKANRKTKSGHQRSPPFTSVRPRGHHASCKRERHTSAPRRLPTRHDVVSCTPLRP